MINDLFQGTSANVIKCLDCGNVKEKQDRFLDLSLTVRDDFKQVTNSSVEEALANYVATEQLTGDNQYSCDLCAKKCDAEIGI
jgi:ubiquitin C-terminal hydrolase